jgi:hypothetical protein
MSGSAEPAPQPRRIEPLGAPTDLTHPLPPVRGQVARVPLTDDQLRGIGRFLAFGWYVSVALRFMFLTGSSSETWEWLTWLIPALYLVAVNSYAVRTGQRRILSGFWPWVLAGIVLLLALPTLVFFFALMGLA